ncbi:MAG: DUF6754 domain-containing protein [Candidatus Sumerlaeaceae bacterium]
MSTRRFTQTAHRCCQRAPRWLWVLGAAMSLWPHQATAASAARVLPREWNYVDVEKLPVFVALVLFGGFYFYLYRQIQAGRPMRLRRLPGIDAIEEAIARATEMGRPVLFIPGINDIDDIQTLAGLNILSHVAYIAAEYNTPLIVACRRSVVLTISEEVVKAASLAAGRPENYIPNNMRYLSDDQFAFTAGVNGIMLREQPASCIYQGCFYSESLILAETGYVSGAIQVAGTANVAQLPFFVAACDFTLIGEEFFAASAYLSRDPTVVASIEAADWLKMVYLVVIFAGVVLATALAFLPHSELATLLGLLKELF